MSDLRIIRAEDVEAKLDWTRMVNALAAGHRLPRAQVSDQFLPIGNGTLMGRMAVIEGLGAGLKTFTVMPDRDPSVQGVMLVYDADGVPQALVDFDLVTKWKTVADSLLGVRLLARPDAQRVLIVGTGKVARQLAEAYPQFLPDCEVRIWGRDTAKAAAIGEPVGLEEGVAWADIISTATLSETSLIRGEWLREGQHLDLIGSFRAGMREADDESLQRCRIYVDSRESAAHVGEIADPLARGVITAEDIRGDIYDMLEGGMGGHKDNHPSLFKNAGGAHLDLMVAAEILATFEGNV